MENRWKCAEEIIQSLEDSGFQAYFVGGCVRDILLERPVIDIDITTSALPEDTIGIFDNVIPTGIEHGTVLVRHKGHSFEVTTFRSEGTYTDKRRPDEVTFITDIQEDLSRRDFTINAMAMNKNYALIDLYEGRIDLKNRLIRTVGDAKDRFQEDALRMLRAIRFSSQLSFTIETDTFAQIKVFKEEVEYVAVERIKEECEKLFRGDDVNTGVTSLHASGLGAALPIFKNHHTLLDDILKRNLTPFASFADVIALFYYLHEEVSINTWIREWKGSNKEKKRAKELHRYLVYYNENQLDDWLAYQIKDDYIEPFCQLIEIIFSNVSLQSVNIKNKKTTLPIQKREEMDIDGHTVAGLYPELKKGIWIKEILDELEYLIVTEQLENKHSNIKEWIMCHPPAKG